MSQIINKFDILSKLNEDFKREIKLFYVFNNYIKENKKYNPIGFNALIVAQNERVYAIGDNSCGQLGLGHNEPVKDPTIVDQLCNKQIVDFVNGSTYCMARDNCGNVYFFGSKVFSFGSSDYFKKPELMEGLNEKPVIAMSSGSYHSLLLTKFGEVYAWGENKFGQIGNGSNNDQLENPIRIEGFDNEKVVMISCGAVFSMALTESGRVYSWGHKALGKLGIESNRSLDNRRPNRVSIEDHLIAKISCGHSHSLLLTKNGEIYAFGDNKCGQLGIGSYEIPSIPMKLDMKNIEDISSHGKYSLSIALTKDQTYYVWGYLFDQRKKISKPEPTKYKSFDEIFADRLKVTQKPILIEENLVSVPEVSKKSSNYSTEFKELSLISSGSFGIVYKAQHINDKKIYAIKKIPLNETENTICREIEMMENLRSDFIVEYKDSWIQENYFLKEEFENKNHSEGNISRGHPVFDPRNIYLLYIQMELCIETLKQVMNMLSNEIKKDPQNLLFISYFISSALFEEILESVDFLHKNNIIHRDLKPANILITNGTNGRFAKVSDFGLAIKHEFDDQSHTKESGTWNYMAPEVKLGRHYNTKADIYSLGVIIEDLFHLDNEKSNNSITDNTIKQKTKKLVEMKEQMKSDNKDVRPDCQQILNEKHGWTLGFAALKDVNYFKEIIKEKSKTESLEECFHRFFVKKKFEIFYKSLSIVKQNIDKDITNHEITELCEMWDKIVFAESE